MPDVELGINDIWRQGKEVVGRHDIIPVATEEWIRLENVEFHSCVQQDEYEKSRIIKCVDFYIASSFFLLHSNLLITNCTNLIFCDEINEFNLTDENNVTLLTRCVH